MALRDVRATGSDTDNKLFQKIADTLAIALGQRGHDRYTSGTNTGEWAILHAIGGSVVTVIREGASETMTLIAGDRIYGYITSVTVTSGDVELYRMN